MEFIWFGSKSKLADFKLLNLNLTICSVVIEPTDSVRDLGVILDKAVNVPARWQTAINLLFSPSSHVSKKLEKSRGPACRKVEILSSNILQFSNYFLAFRFFLLLYLLVPTYTIFICAPSCQNFHYFNISFDNPLLFIIHRPLLSLIVHV